MIVVGLSFVTGVVMFVVDVIRFAPARHKIQLMSSKLQSIIDASESSDEEDVLCDEDSCDDSDQREHFSIFKKRGENDESNVS